MNKYRLRLTIVLLLFLLSACRGPESTGQEISVGENILPSQIPTNTQSPTATLKATHTPKPTVIPTGTLTNSATIEPTRTASASSTPTVGLSYEDAEIISVGYLDNGLMMVAVEVPGGFDGLFYAVVDGYEYSCEFLETYQDRLYCFGTAPDEGTQAEFVVFEGEADGVWFGGRFGRGW